MSDAIFPVLSGIEWGVLKTPIFSTNIQTSVSGRELRIPLQTYPRWAFKLSYALMNDATTQDLRTLVGFFLQRQGAFDSFLYEDTSDNAVGGTATGDGVTKSFTMPNAASLIVYVNGTINNSWTTTTPNVITFTNAPANGAVIIGAQIIGTGDEVTTDFQLIRSYGGFSEPIQAPHTISAIYVNGTSVGYTLGANGVITLNTATGTNNQSITTRFTYYYRCRFLEDKSDFNQFMSQLWENKSISFITEKF